MADLHDHDHDHGHAHHQRHDHAGHGHGHAHGHGHHHAPASFDRAFAIGIALNIAYVLAEGGAGWWTGSVALLADAGHNLSDVLGLAVAWGGASLARKPATKRFTYGLKGSTILAALLNALFLLVALGAIVLEAVQRIGDPPVLAGLTVSAVAGVGILVNALTAWLFARGRHGDVNIRGAFLHMLSDALVSAGVVIAGIVIWATGIGWIDPVVSLVIAALIFWQTWGLLRETVELSLAGVPRGIDYDRVAAALLALPGVTRLHDLHIWAMSTTEPVLTAHLLMPGGPPGDAFLADARDMLRRDFAIGHATLQVETGEDCAVDC
ncbi:cation diffusion facilitator family transporter [Sphingomonas sp. CFBP 8760]|uniref:cation diffusion facilitator family transporter n=1 Tax=Sphingomonas sp. CFBP 8760 TaxID=2775282 RepID=UPI001782B5EB|nr:cation diffusion facilitator family transporter [Sphingomonas sp. CFBP 8760]MBD8547724.1 cation transporter [Sphingomonas sp. CFBP 8760]